MKSALTADALLLEAAVFSKAESSHAEPAFSALPMERL
jgi:hypothetical protein